MHSDEESFEELAREPRKVGWVWLVYLLLYAAAIPWYWPRDYRGPLVGGFPLWAAVSLAGMVALAGWTAWVIGRYWRCEGEE